MFAETCIECQIKLQPETEKEKLKSGILSYKELLYVSLDGQCTAIQIFCEKNCGQWLTFTHIMIWCNLNVTNGLRKPS